MPAASRLSVTSVSCKSIKNCLYFTRGWIKRRFISYPFKKRVRERMAEGQDNFRGRFLNRILSEGSPVGIDSPLPWMAPVLVSGAAEDGSFPGLNLALGAPCSISVAKTYIPAPGSLLKPYLHPSDIYVALVCFWKTWFLSQSPKLKLGLQLS